MLVKASRITNLTDARYFAAKEVQYLGFLLEEGAQGFLDPMYMKAIREWVAGPKITGEFRQASTGYVAEAAAFFQLDAVQIPAEKHAHELHRLQGIDLILEIDGRLPLTEIREIFQETSPFAACFLLNFNEMPDWQAHLQARREVWRELLGAHPVLLEADVSAAQLHAVFSAFPFAGISVAGGEEEATGIKSFDEIEEIFEVLTQG